MTDDFMAQALERWLATRPESVRKLAAEFPLGTTFLIKGERFYLLGYNENDMIIISKINPHEEYDEALANKEYVCAEHVRTASTIAPGKR